MLDSQNLHSNVRELVPLHLGVRHWKDFKPNPKYLLEALPGDLGCFHSFIFLICHSLLDGIG